MGQARRKNNRYEKEVNEILEALDDSGDGEVDLYEFETALKKPDVVRRLATMDLESGDAKTLYNLLDNGDGKLTLQELVRGISRLRGQAGSIDVAALGHRAAHIEAAVLEIYGLLKKCMRQMRSESA